MKVREIVGLHLRPHDLRRHAAIYASRSGIPIEIVSNMILRHADLSTTQRYSLYPHQFIDPPVTI
jgi:integrase/recombinase XerD